MSENKTTCPVCFTKMQQINHSLTCPECGYRYCDHSYENRDLYSTDHVHTPQYTTASVKTTYQTQNTQNAQPRQVQNTANTQPRYSQPTPANRPAVTPSERQVKSAKSAISIIRTIIIIYILGVFATTILPIIFQLFSELY